ncbi:MAG: hypothetical protein IPK32_11130 [Verrucomicrobiaceae bacterium]|nr:hypothetical protein [Verrucomicrobiaceae bacterium]
MASFLESPSVLRHGRLPTQLIVWVFTALGAFWPLGSSQAATSSIVGFTTWDLPSGNSAWVCGLVTANAYEGAAATVTADGDGKALVQFSAPGWTVGAFNQHYAEPLSGGGAGLALDILWNTEDTLKLDTTPAEAGLTNGMVFVVRKHTTLGGLLPDGGGFTPFSDTISLFGSNGLQTSYFYSSFPIPGSPCWEWTRRMWWCGLDRDL